MIQINLLPWREQSRKAKKKRFIFVYIAFICLAFLALIAGHIYLDGMIHYRTKLNDILQAEITTQQDELNNFNTKATEMRDVQDNLKSIIGLYNRNFNAIRLLNELVNLIPRNVMLDKVIRNNDMITMSGIAQSDSDVTLFMQDISKSPIFNQPVLTGITSHKEGTTSSARMFQLNVQQKE